MDQQSIIYKFILSPRFKIWRILSIIIFFIVVSCNQAMVTYSVVSPKLGHNVYWVIACTVLIYILTLFLTFRIFIPKYLSENKYLQFIICIIINAIIYTLIPNFISILYFDDYDFFSIGSILDNLSSFTVYFLCIFGVVIPVFIKNWISSKELLNQLEKKQQLSQIEQLKEQLNPDSFFRILNKSATIAKTQPDKASLMLMKLGQLLRYQLYDCNRDQVLLNAEVSFLKNFMELESLYSSHFSYELTIKDDISKVFIPPSILLPYVQSAMNALDNKSNPKIDITISNDEKNISIVIKILDIGSDISLENVKQRLDTLYNNKYILTIAKIDSGNEAEVALILNKE